MLTFSGLTVSAVGPGISWVNGRAPLGSRMGGGRGEYRGLLQVERGGIGPIRPFGGVNRHMGRAAPGVVAWACVALLW
jgi:hypothetical protein